MYGTGTGEPFWILTNSDVIANALSFQATGKVDTDTITIAGGTVAASDITTFSSGNIPHNLGYTPAFIVYTTGGGGSFSLFGGDSIGAWSDAGTTIAIEYFVRENVTVTSTYIRFSISVNNARNYSFTYGGPDIKYYLLQETAS